MRKYRNLLKNPKDFSLEGDSVTPTAFKPKETKSENTT